MHITPHDVTLIFFFALALGAAWLLLRSATYTKPPKRMQPRCPKCDSAKVFGEPGHRVCTNCGAFQSEDPTWQ
jgi:hypothetical protein